MPSPVCHAHKLNLLPPKCSRLLHGMFRELFEQIINTFFPAGIATKWFLLLLSLFFVSLLKLCKDTKKNNDIKSKKVLRCIWNFKKYFADLHNSAQKKKKRRRKRNTEMPQSREENNPKHDKKCCNLVESN